MTHPAAAQTIQPAPTQPAPIQIVALGDSLTAGYGLADKDGFVPRLQAALTTKGIAAAIANAGVSGDTASDGLARLDWSVPERTDAVIVELGANDMLRGIRPDVTRDALDKILQRLTARHIAVILCGMRAAPNLGADYGQAFERIYPELAAKYSTLLYPFFLDGVAGDLKLVQQDGLHPNATGVGIIVERILPKILQLIDQVHAQHPS
jgi:acyl-CoA thioesterase-1